MSSPTTPDPVSGGNSVAATASPSKNRRSFLLGLLGVTVLVGLIVWGAWYLVEGRWHESTDDAYVGGNVVPITPRIAGTVVSIEADDGDLVHAGDVLVRLDPSDTAITLERAKASLASEVRKVRGLYFSVNGARADVAMYRTAVNKARADYDRRVTLAKAGAISLEEVEHARETLTSAESALVAAQQRYRIRNSLVDATVVASHPDVRVASERLRAAFLDHMRSTLLAPVDGYVAKRLVQVGQRVQPGAALMAVVPLHEAWVDANFKETQLRRMRIGQPVAIESDLYGGTVTYTGRIRQLGVGTGSAFSLLPAQNATGNWIKIVQRVPVRVAFDDPQQLRDHPLRLGMSVTAAVELHDQDGQTLAQESPKQAAYSTSIYQRQLAKADAVIAQIVRDNTTGTK
jgi:membrane fusion protein (multidrug efflux system)